MASFFRSTSGSATVTQGDGDIQDTKWKTQKLVLRLQENASDHFRQGMAGTKEDLSKLSRSELEQYSKKKFGNLRKVLNDGLDDISNLVEGKQPTEIVRGKGESDKDFQKRKAQYDKTVQDYLQFMKWVEEIVKHLTTWMEQMLHMLKQFLQDLWEAKQRGDNYVRKTDEFLERMRKKMAEMQDIFRTV